MSLHRNICENIWFLWPARTEVSGNKVPTKILYLFYIAYYSFQANCPLSL